MATKTKNVIWEEKEGEFLENGRGEAAHRNPAPPPPPVPPLPPPLQKIRKGGPRLDFMRRLWLTFTTDDLLPPANDGDAASTRDELTARALFEEHAILEDNRWHVPLPLRDDEESIKRLEGLLNSGSLERVKAIQKKVWRKMSKLDAAERMSCWLAYEKCWRIMEPLGTSEIYQPAHYLPSMPVFTESSTTHRWRWVQLANTKDSYGTSINSLLLEGEMLLRDLLSIFLHFRVGGQYAICADVEKMFWAISILKRYRYLVRTVLRDEEGNDVICEVTRLLFGLNCSPSIVAQCLQATGRMFAAEFPLAAILIKKFIYQDDLLWSDNDFNRAKTALKELVEICQKASFRWHKIGASDPGLLEGLAEEDVSRESEVRVLGSVWLKDKDCLLLTFANVIEPDNFPETRRTAASQVGKLWESTGLLSPLSTPCKIISQWGMLATNSWDEALPDEMQDQLRAWKHVVRKMSPITVSRYCRKPDSTYANTAVHTFSDASKSAYCSASYMVSWNEEGEAVSHLLFCKVKMAPLSKSKQKIEEVQTIARLECSGILLASIVTSYLRQQFPEIPEAHFFIHTDSLLNIWRLRKGARHYNTWISNRLTKILENIPLQQIKFCPNLLNSADSATRFVTPEQLEPWLSGAPYICCPVSELKFPPESAEPPPEVMWLEAASQRVIEKREEDKIQTRAPVDLQKNLPCVSSALKDLTSKKNGAQRVV